MSEPQNGTVKKGAGAPRGGELLTELGRSGVRHYSGYIYDDDDPRLRGLNAIRLYREMMRDPTVAAMLFALSSLIRSVSWRIEAGDETTEHQEARDFADEVLFQDMDHPWEDFVADACTMFPYGFAPFEVVFKKRAGIPKGADPVTGGSIYNDGRFGLKKLALRSQDTVQRWDLDPDTDEIRGIFQLDPVRGREVHIPAERLLLLRTTPNRGNPEGESILRAAVRPYGQKLELEKAEGSVALRASGIVEMRIPVSEYNDPAKRAVWEGIAQMVADDRAGYALLPTVLDKDGKEIPGYKLGYIVADGRRSGDFSPIIQRKKQEMASVVLADFILLGHNNKGALALSTDKTELFAQAVMAWLRSIAAQVNRVVLPRLWAVNGMDRLLMPTVVPADLDKENLQVLGAYITALVGAGATLDDALEDALRAKANLPLKPKVDEVQSDGGAPKLGTDNPSSRIGINGGPPLSDVDAEGGTARNVTKSSVRTDIAFLKASGPDDPAYREALAVLARGPIPVDVDEGGVPTAGQSPFEKGRGAGARHRRVGEGCGNPYHDPRTGRFVAGPGGRAIKRFAAAAQDKQNRDVMTMTRVRNAIDLLAASGLNPKRYGLDRYVYTLGASEVRKIQGKHGPGKAMAMNGALPIEVADYKRLPSILLRPDAIRAGSRHGSITEAKGNDALPSLVFEKQIGSMRYEAVVTVQRKQWRIALLTFYKNRAK